MIKTKELLDLNHTLAGDYLAEFEFPWQALPGLKNFIIALGNKLNTPDYDEIKPQVWVHKSASIAESAFITAPCIIGSETEVRHCAFIRGSVLIGNNCVVGNSAELKNAVLFDSVQTPHYNYVGDSILGYKSHMGAGSITSNVKSDKTLVTIKNQDKIIKTGMKKLGAVLGDFAEIGCNTVLNPGTIIGRRTNVYPLSSVRGIVPSESIYKTGGLIVDKK